MKLVILGCGSSGIFVLSCIAENVSRNEEFRNSISSITIINEKSLIGDQGSFGNVSDSFILNTSNLSLDPILPKWKKFRDEKMSGKSSYRLAHYSKRADFGAFLSHLLECSITQIRRYITLEIKIATVMAVNYGASSIEVLASGNVLTADKIIMCLGNGRQRSKSSNAVGPLFDIYSTDLKCVSSEESIGIVGAGLRAVDCLRALYDLGHKGPIHIASHSGRLPRIQPIPSMETFENISSEKILGKFIKNPISLQVLWNALKMDFALNDIDLNSIKEILDTSPTNCENWSQELNQAEFGNRLWYQRIFFLTSYMEEIWQYVSPKSKKNFITHLRDRWMSNIIGIPVENGKVIEKLFKSKQLSIHPDYIECRRSSSSKKFRYEILCRKAEPIGINHIIDATPFGIDGGTLSPLICSLSQNSTVKFTAFGIIDCDWSTRQALDAHGKILNGFYCVGEFSLGPNLVPSSIESNLRMANLAVSDIVGKTSSNYIPLIKKEKIPEQHYA